MDKRLRFYSSIEESRLKKMKKLSESDINDDFNLQIGRRIVDINVLANNLECKNCEETLSLNREKKIRAGFNSTFSVECKVWCMECS